jgi:hypothetical protein
LIDQKNALNKYLEKYNVDCANLYDITGDEDKKDAFYSKKVSDLENYSSIEEGFFTETLCLHNVNEKNKSRFDCNLYFTGRKLILEVTAVKTVDDYDTYTIAYKDERDADVKCHISLSSANLNEHAFLLEKLKQSSGSIKIKANGTPYLYRSGIFEMYLSKLISIDDCAVPDDIDTSVIKDLFLQNGDFIRSLSIKNMPSIYNSQELTAQAVMIQNQLSAAEKEMNLIPREYTENIVNRIGALLNLNLFRQLSNSDKMQTWKLTQIFSNDKNYSVLWRVLRRLDNKIEYTSECGIDNNYDDFIVKKADRLYEYWTLFRTLSFLVNDQKWLIKRIYKSENIYIEGEDLLLRALKEYFSGGKDDTEGDGVAFELTHKIDGGSEVPRHLKMNLTFNKKIGRKKPDFGFEITEYAGEQPGESHWFFLDTKYRNYSEMNHSWWYRDLSETALGKYLFLCNEFDDQTMASFILHTDKQRADYFGGLYNRGDREHFLEELNKIKEASITDKKAVDEFLEAKCPGHKFGSVCFLPSHTEGLKLLLKLFLEYHLDYWNICWNCGNIHPAVEKKKTDGGFDKFHITCGDCNAFWVRSHCRNLKGTHKLIKRSGFHYHTSKAADDPWYTICPKCGDGIRS